MRIEGIKFNTPHVRSRNSNLKRDIVLASSPSVSFSGKNLKNSFLQKLEAYITAKISPQKEDILSEVTQDIIKPDIIKPLPKTPDIIVNNQKKALYTFVRDENFSEKVMVRYPDKGAYEIYERMFDAASHETRINADYYDVKGRLDHTTVYDNNGLMLSKYYVKINNPKDPISIRRKDFNVNGKLTREEIKYKNGDISYADYDDIYNTQTFKNVKSDGSITVVKNTRYASETWRYDKNGNQIDHSITEYQI